MLGWLTRVVLPHLVLLFAIGSLCYICLSFRLYQIGIGERSRRKKVSARNTLFISIVVLIAAVILRIKMDYTSYWFFVLPFD